MDSNPRFRYLDHQIIVRGLRVASANTVIHNTINEACAGILAGTGTSGNTTTPNTFFNVTNIILSGDVCPAATAGSAQAQLQRDSGRPVLVPAE